MIRAELTVVPPGGGEADYTMMVDFPALPRQGDYISISRENVPDDDKNEHVGNTDFIVRRVWWIGKMDFSDPSPEPVGKCSAAIECEYAIGPFSSTAHKKNAAFHHEYRGKPKPTVFEPSGY